MRPYNKIIKKAENLLRDVKIKQQKNVMSGIPIEVYKNYCLDYAERLSKLKNIELADELTQQLKCDTKIRKIASENVGNDTEMECHIFEQLLWLVPEFNRQYARDVLKEFLINGNADQDVHNLFVIDGTKKKAKREIEMVVWSIVQKINGGKINVELVKRKI